MDTFEDREFAPFFDVIAQGGIEGFCGDRRFEPQVGESMLAREAFDFCHDGGCDSTSRRIRSHIAGPQFRRCATGNIGNKIDRLHR